MIVILHNQIDAYVQDQIKMKNQIKTMIMIGLIVLLVTTISAREYSLVEKPNKVTVTFYSDLLDKELTFNWENDVNFDKGIYGSHENYIQSKMDENELMRYNYTAWFETYETKETATINNIEEPMGEGFVWNFIKKMIDWIKGVEDRTDYLENENQKFKDCIISSKNFDEYKNCIKITTPLL